MISLYENGVNGILADEMVSSLFLNVCFLGMGKLCPSWNKVILKGRSISQEVYSSSYANWGELNLNQSDARPEIIGHNPVVCLCFY